MLLTALFAASCRPCCPIHGLLQNLLAQHGPAYSLNLRVFYDLQRTITGWPGERSRVRGQARRAAVKDRSSGACLAQ